MVVLKMAANATMAQKIPQKIMIGEVIFSSEAGVMFAADLA